MKQFVSIQNETIRRTARFLVGVCISAVGVAFASKSGLGTTPLSLPAYVLSQVFPALHWRVPHPSAQRIPAGAGHFTAAGVSPVQLASASSCNRIRKGNGSGLMVYGWLQR
ncbi:MAG: hypothetical protein LIO54_01565 [Oscillospiraceae bacterium]|nr:hypothetical protein [Oscillospiraceae bacterium]